MWTRRDFMKMLGASAGSLYAAPYLAGCGAESAAANLGFPVSNVAPTLGGDPARDWWMRGNYGPVVDEIDALNLEVSGSIPPELNGMFLRNGANPLEDSPHWFLGDGMLHGVRLENGKALSYRNRFIGTAAYKGEASGLAANMGNTALLHHHDKLLALYEVGPPHECDPFDLSTTGVYDFGGAIKSAVTAHPKVDKKTGELFMFGYSPVAPFLTYYVVDAQGAVIHKADIDIPQPTMMHDFQLTETHAIFMDLPIVMDLTLLSTGFPFRWAPEAGARIGVMPRKGTGADMTWFEVDLCYMFHTFNAYNQGKSVVLEGCRLNSLWAGGPEEATETPTPWRWTLNTETGKASEAAFEDRGMDFPMIDKRLQGRPHRYAYGLHLTPGTDAYPAHPIGLLKVDHETGRTDLWATTEAAQPDEALFIPASEGASEDEGWLMTMVYNRAEDISEVVILDAQQVASGPIARIKMPRRVPFGFHGTWVPA